MCPILHEHSLISMQKSENVKYVMGWPISIIRLAQSVVIRGEMTRWSVWSRTISICSRSIGQACGVGDIMSSEGWSHRSRGRLQISSTMTHSLLGYSSLRRYLRSSSRWIPISSERQPLSMRSDICHEKWRSLDYQNDSHMQVLSNMQMRLHYLVHFGGEDNSNKTLWKNGFFNRKIIYDSFLG